MEIGFWEFWSPRRWPLTSSSAPAWTRYAFDLSDEQVVERWSESVVWQFFSGMDCYQHKLHCDATQIGRFRRVLGEAGVEHLLKTTIETAVTIKAVKPAEFERVLVA